MTLDEALAQQPEWVQVWVVVLTILTVALPMVLLWWRETRLAASLALLATVAGGVGVQVLSEQSGYTRLLALPHVLLWTPTLAYLIVVLQRSTVRRYARAVGTALAVVLAVSLVFDWASVVRYALGERAPMTTER